MPFSPEEIRHDLNSRLHACFMKNIRHFKLPFYFIYNYKNLKYEEANFLNVTVHFTLKSEYQKLILFGNILKKKFQKICFQCLGAVPKPLRLVIYILYRWYDNVHIFHLIPWNLKSLQPLGHSGKDAIRVGRHELSSQSQPFTYT